MKRQTSLEFPLWGDDRFENGNRRMVGEIVHIRAGVMAEGAGFRLFDKPGGRVLGSKARLSSFSSTSGARR